MKFFKFSQTRYQIPLREICARARTRSFVTSFLSPCPLVLRDGLRKFKEFHFIQFTLVFLVLAFLTTGCALLKPAPSIDDPLINFYSTTPPAHTQAALRLTEKARAELKAGKQGLAIEHLEKALMIDPQCPFAYYFLALSTHQNGEYKKSNGFLEKAKQLFSSFPFWKAQSYTLSGQNFEKLGNKKMAQAQFKKAKEIERNL